ncbi:hypothetical protein JCM11491_003787 [Sporobolomyces phaffii]
MSHTSRPAIKRQYGSRKAAPTSTSSRASGSSSSGPTSSSSSPPQSSILSASVNSEWEAAVRDSSPVERDAKRKRRSSTPPTSSPLTATAEPTRLAPDSKRKREKAPARLDDSRRGGGGGDLRSFFVRTSPPRAVRNKTRRESPFEVDDDELGSVKSRSTSRPPLSAASSNSSRSTRTKLSQLYLDPFDTPGRSTLHCPTCALSYSRTPEDVNFHAKHHKKVVSGIDWSDASAAAGTTTTNGANGITVCRDGIEWKGGKEEGRVLMIDWSTADSSTKRRLSDVMSTIDTELSSTGLTDEQLAASKAFLFVTTRTRKVVACAVVQRITHAYQVVANDRDEDDVDLERDARQGLIRFDNQDSSAIFCSPTPLPTLLGVHRIWTSNSHRRHGFASLLLDDVAERFLYACPIARRDRAQDVAFSQPTGKGQELAKRWTGTNKFKVFVD